MSQLGHCSVSASFPQSACKHFRFAGDSEFMSEMQKQMQPKNSNSESAVSRSGLRGCLVLFVFCTAGQEDLKGILSALLVFVLKRV
jgi:hypothetical protein